MIEKTYKVIFWIFLSESVLILLGINLNMISYGIDVQTPFMAIGIFLGLVIGTGFKFALKNFNSKFRQVIAIILSVIMLFLCFYYILEDKFKITI